MAFICEGIDRRVAGLVGLDIANSWKEASAVQPTCLALGSTRHDITYILHGYPRCLSDSTSNPNFLTFDIGMARFPI